LNSARVVHLPHRRHGQRYHHLGSRPSGSGNDYLHGYLGYPRLLPHPLHYPRSPYATSRPASTMPKQAFSSLSKSSTGTGPPGYVARDTDVRLPGLERPNLLGWLQTTSVPYAPGNAIGSRSITRFKLTRVSQQKTAHTVRVSKTPTNPSLLLLTTLDLYNLAIQNFIFSLYKWRSQTFASSNHEQFIK